MEWVEVTAKTIEEAKDEALDRLGVDESEAEFEILEEPKAGLFGRLRSEARVRARVAPTAVRPKVERGSRRRGRKDRAEDNGPSKAPAPAPAPAAAAEPSGGEGAGGGRSANGGSRARSEKRSKPATDKGEAMYDAQEPEGDAGEVGEEFLNGLISAFGVQGSVSRALLDDGDTLELAVEGDDVGMLIGPRGATLSAIQELTRTVAQRKAGGGSAPDRRRRGRLPEGPAAGAGALHPGGGGPGGGHRCRPSARAHASGRPQGGARHREHHRRGIDLLGGRGTSPPGGHPARRSLIRR